jgi:hypothetical protein
MIKFFIVGTSKSLDGPVYYRKERFKIWGSLYFAGVTKKYWKNELDFSTGATRAFSIENGFDFYDVIPFIASSDKNILDKLTFHNKEIASEISAQLKQKFNSFNGAIHFNGKTSFYYFTYFYFNSHFEISSFRIHCRNVNKLLKKESITYGKLNKGVVDEIFNSKLTNVLYLLPNTSSRMSQKTFDEFIWIESLKEANK